MSVTRGLTEFLTARLAEDEERARFFATVPALANPRSEKYTLDAPARLLREVEAKRQILTRYEFAHRQIAVGDVNETAGYGAADPGWPLRANSHELDLYSLAAVYSDHPDYDAAWK